MTGSPIALRRSPSHIVIGATDPVATRRFFAAFDFVDDEARSDSMVRGLGQRTELEIVEADAGRRLVDYDRGPRGLDIYTRDVDRTVEAAAAVGAEPGPIAEVEIGPMVMRQVTIWGPDGIPLVAIENSSRRSSLLDDHEDELHSEIHSLVWAVDSRDRDAAWFTGSGLTAGMALSFAEPAVATFMRLPDPVVQVDMVMLADADNTPIRFELLEFAERDGAPFGPADAAAAGIQAIGFTVDGVDRADGAVAQRVVTPGGVVVDVRSGGAL